MSRSQADTVVFGKTEYLVAAYGSFVRRGLRGDTVEQIQVAGGEVVESLLFHHVGTVTGDEPTAHPGKE